MHFLTLWFTFGSQADVMNVSDFAGSVQKDACCVFSQKVADKVCVSWHQPLRASLRHSAGSVVSVSVQAYLLRKQTLSAI